MLVGNKIDLFDRENVVEEEKGKELADKNGIGFFQTSAQAKIGIKELFVYAVVLVVMNIGRILQVIISQANLLLIMWLLIPQMCMLQH